ncbi:hypothetical protein Scep_001562 [Stephania cephalantha]|uniref:Uncharacterized protein n=1 Tax=Stephania cephalantha TaxID=152367 RepID=A0AAP0L8F1_9MAGN
MVTVYLRYERVRAGRQGPRPKLRGLAWSSHRYLPIECTLGALIRSMDAS